MTLLISEGAEISGVGTTATSADLNGDIIDMDNFEAIAIFGRTAATNASTWLKFQTGTATDAMSDTTGEVAATLTTLFMEQKRANKRFVRGVYKGATTTSVYRTLVTVAYGGRTEPTTAQANASSTGIRVYSPVSGTATG